MRIPGLKATPMQVPLRLSRLEDVLGQEGDRLDFGKPGIGVAGVLVLIWLIGVWAIVGWFVLATGKLEVLQTFGWVLPAMTLFAYLMGGWRWRLILDGAERTYFYQFGLYPFYQRRSGSLGDFERLELIRQLRHAPGATGGYYTLWLVRLVGPERSPAPGQRSAPDPLLLTLALQDSVNVPRLVRLKELASTLAHKVGVPFQDRTEEDPLPAH